MGKNSAASVPRVTFADGAAVPALGLGTWRYGEAAPRRKAEVASLRHALDLGFRLFDTAEMYGDGGAEEALGMALAGAFRAGLAREQVFVVSKVYPHNASRRDVRAACERSLKRLQLDRIDLYLLHWRGSVPLADTVAGFEDLRAAGHIARWGVSNFDVDDLEELTSITTDCSANQVWYSLGERGPEFALLPWQRARGMPLMAYSPLDQGALGGSEALARIAARHGATPAQVALAALIARPGVIAIPKAFGEAHQREVWGAASLVLDVADRSEIDAAFPPPKRKPPLAIT